MTERGLPGMDRAPACPFVAFADDRESRSTSPDHRHRCYADVVPSPRAAAHQEAYCLSSAFPVCPTFQDWARREAAQAKADRKEAARSAKAAAAAAAATEDPRGSAERQGPAEEWGGESRHAPPAVPDLPVRRNPPRDWAAPPPWATGAGAQTAGRPASASVAPEFLAGRGEEGRGLAGSAADRLAAGMPRAAESKAAPPTPRPQDGAASVAPDAELGGLVSVPRDDLPDRDYLPPRNNRRPTVSSTRGRQHHPDRDAIVGPSWERARRFEAYPTLRARTGLSLPNPPRLALLAGALAIAAIALFFLPALLGVGGGGRESPAPNPSSSGAAAPSQSVAPSEPAAPTQQVYTIKPGDTLSKVATDFGLTLEELLAANPTIVDPDKIGIGDEVVIPTRPPDEFTDPSASPS